MAEPFIGEIRLFSFNYPPHGWALCDGSTLLIAQNQALYSLLGTTFGGDGRTTFGLPDLRGRVPAHPGTVITPGKKAGEESHTLITAEMPVHTHLVEGNSEYATAAVAKGNVWAKSDNNPYDGTITEVMSQQALNASGGGVAHANMQPYMVVNYCIAVQGYYPPRD